MPDETAVFHETASVEEPVMHAEMQITATAHATHPEGAVVPPPFPNPALTQE